MLFLLVLIGSIPYLYKIHPYKSKTKAKVASHNFKSSCCLQDCLAIVLNPVCKFTFECSTEQLTLELGSDRLTHVVIL